MKKKVSDLTGVELDYAVAVADSHKANFSPEDCAWGKRCFRKADSGFDLDSDPYSPTTNWQQCGEILERERISLNMTRGLITRQPRYWTAISDDEKHGADDHDPKVAICKCFVRTKLGEEVEIPE